MSTSELGRMLRSFPWDLCRSVYASPIERIPYVISGISFDWEHLLLSSFMDAKTLIREWLLFRRIFSKPDDIDFSDLQIIQTAESLRRTALARSTLYQDYGYFNMVAMAYLYMCSVYAEERETLSVFCAFHMESDAALERTVRAKSSTGSSSDFRVDAKEVPQLVFPDWPTLSRWLRCSVEADLQSAPALLAAAALSASQTRGSSSTTLGTRAATGLESFTMEAARRLLQLQLAGPSPPQPRPCAAPAALFAASTGKRPAADCGAEGPAAKAHAVARDAQETLLQAAPPPGGLAAVAVKSGEDQRYQQARQLLPLQTAATVATYRHNPNQHASTRRVQTMSAHAGTSPALGAGYGQRDASGAAFSYAPDGRFIAAAGLGTYAFHPALGVFGGAGAGTSAAYGDGGSGGPLPQQMVAGLRQAQAQVSISCRPSSEMAAAERGSEGVPQRADAAFQQGQQDGCSAAPTTAAAAATSFPKALFFSGAFATDSYASGSDGALSPQPPLPVAQAAQLLQALAGAPAQQPPQSHAALVNRRQKKNRDKFRVTFKVSPALISELQRLRVGVLDAHPGSLEWAGSSEAASLSVLVPLKGIDVLTNGRYRVQLNTFMSGRKKFSRNSTDLYEALWIFEIALLISDSPSLLSELQRIGNYNCLAPLGHLGFFGSPREYYLELGRHILLFYDTVDFFNEDLIMLAIQNYNALRPAVAVTQRSLPAVAPQQPYPVKSEFPIHHPGHLSHHSSNNTIATAASTVASRDSGDDDGNDAEPAVADSSAAGGRSCPVGSRYEALGPLAWMAGFDFGRSLQDQHLSCLSCLRSLPPPTWLPRIVMVKEDRGPHPQAAAAASSTGAGQVGPPASTENATLT